MIATDLSIYASGLVIFISKYSWYLLYTCEFGCVLCEYSSVANFLEENVLVDIILI